MEPILLRHQVDLVQDQDIGELHLVSEEIRECPLNLGSSDPSAFYCPTSTPVWRKSESRSLVLEVRGWPLNASRV